jgi:nicotinamidase-related amidase
MLTPANTVLIVMDMQDRLVSAMPDELRSVTVDNVIRLVQGARILNVPLVVTEQYPAGLGATIEPVNHALAEFGTPPPRVAKVDFNACEDARFLDAVQSSWSAEARQAPGRRSLVLCGMDTHICVYQTARALADSYDVYVPFDATCSRRQDDSRVALRLLERSGVAVTTTETVLFELLGRAGSSEFKAISKLVR